MIHAANTAAAAAYSNPARLRIVVSNDGALTPVGVPASDAPASAAPNRGLFVAARTAVKPSAPALTSREQARRIAAQVEFEIEQRAARERLERMAILGFAPQPVLGPMLVTRAPRRRSAWQRVKACLRRLELD